MKKGINYQIKKQPIAVGYLITNYVITGILPYLFIKK